MKTKTSDKFNHHFMVGEHVNVNALPEDDFHDFTGTIKEINDKYIVVEDQDGDCFSCEESQLSYCSDDIMHN